jgi:hypothetical protein
MSSTTAELTYQQWLNRANLNLLPTIFQKMKLGNMLSPVKVTVASLTATATPDITSAAVLAAASAISGLERETGDRLPAILAVKTLRVTTSGTANTVGSYAITDAAGTALTPTASANVGLALLSDDGTTLTFPTTVTGFVIEYIPRSNTALSDNYPRL